LEFELWVIYDLLIAMTLSRNSCHSIDVGEGTKDAEDIATKSFELLYPMFGNAGIAQCIFWFCTCRVNMY
jgi:hypothetical protein